MNAIVLAAGLGTRLGNYTKECPKALVKVDGIPMLQHQLLHLKKAGVEKTVVNVHHFASMITGFLEENGNFGMDISVSDESGLLLDTGGGIRRAMHLLGSDEPVLVHNVDIFSGTDLKRMYDDHCESGADVTLLTSDRDTTRRLWFDTGMRLRGWSNLLTGQTRSPFEWFSTSAPLKPLAFQGIHVISGKVLQWLDAVGSQKFSITDFYVDHADKADIRAVLCESGDLWVDAGKPDALSRACTIVRECYV